jgi:hypothetical protein
VTGVQTCALPISPKPQNPKFKLQKLNDKLSIKSENRSDLMLSDLSSWTERA